MVRMSRSLSGGTSPSTGLDWNMYFTYVRQGLMSQIDAMYVLCAIGQRARRF